MDFLLAVRRLDRAAAAAAAATATAAEESSDDEDGESLFQTVYAEGDSSERSGGSARGAGAQRYKSALDELPGDSPGEGGSPRIAAAALLEILRGLGELSPAASQQGSARGSGSPEGPEGREGGSPRLAAPDFLRGVESRALDKGGEGGEAEREVARALQDELEASGQLADDLAGAPRDEPQGGLDSEEEEEEELQAELEREMRARDPAFG